MSANTVALPHTPQAVDDVRVTGENKTIKIDTLVNDSGGAAKKLYRRHQTNQLLDLSSTKGADMTSSMMRLLLALSASVLLTATPAVAQSEPVSVAVSFADLDLATEAGRASLDRRIRRAAAAVCSPPELGVHLGGVYDSCCKDAATDANLRIASLRKGEMRVQVAARTQR